MDNSLLALMIANEARNRGITDYFVEDNIEMFSKKSFTLKKNTNEILFVYSQNYYVPGGFFAGNIDVELISEPIKAAYPYAMMENNFIKSVFKAQSNIDFKITCAATITSIIRYIKIIPVKTRYDLSQQLKPTTP